MTFPVKLLPAPVHEGPLHSDPNDQRFGELLVASEGEPVLGAGDSVLIGFPSDLGVRLNHGRAGSHSGSAEIRRCLYGMLGNSNAKGANLQRRKIHDVGSVDCTGEVLLNDQLQLGAAVAHLLERGCFPVVLGGGHETTFGHFMGYANSSRKVSIINIDAHHDVREADQSTSGTPFRQAFEDPSGSLAGYQIIGAQPQSFSPHYLNYLRDKDASVYWREDVREEGPREIAQKALANVAEGIDILITLDMDVIDQSAAPGVSAPCPDGLTSFELFPLIDELMKDQRVSSFDIVEVNPEFDLDNRTARLAALVVHRVLSARR